MICVIPSAARDRQAPERGLSVGTLKILRLTPQDDSQIA